MMPPAELPHPRPRLREEYTNKDGLDFVPSVEVEGLLVMISVGGLIRPVN